MNDLTFAQHSRLDTLAKNEPDSKVVGWLKDGPVLMRDKGGHSRVVPTGRLVPVRYWPDEREAA